MISFSFMARNGEQAIPLDVKLDYQPGHQTQRARRIAVGELLAQLETETAAINASGNDRVTVTTTDGTWVIGESYSNHARRGKL